jgi:hypothetical protein
LSAFTEWTNPAPRRPAEQAWGSPLSSISLFCTVRVDLESTVGTGTTIRIIFPKM